MPLYEFECQTCHTVEEHFLSMDDISNAGLHPSHCDVTMRRIFSPVAVTMGRVNKPWLADGDDQFRDVFGEDPDGD